MITSIELQVISRILTTEDPEELNTLCGYDGSYYSVFKHHIEFILDHYQKYNDVPDVFTFQSQFPDITLVSVSEPIEYLVEELKKNKQHIILLETFNKLKDLGSGDVSDAWLYLSNQCEIANRLDSTRPVDIIKDAQERSDKVIEFNNQSRIPTGFAEIDKLMYGGLSTVEELLLIIARTNTGKSWVCVKMMESAQKHGFPVLYYSPEMQSSFIGTRFDTWRNHFQNSQLYQGKYTDDYRDYIHKLSQESTSAYVLEDKDMPSGAVSPANLRTLVQKYKIKLLIIDGLDYLSDNHKSDTDYVKYKNLCLDLFKISKEFGCAVVVAAQANRETRESKDEKGEPFPSLYNVAGSDHPGRICTQAFSLRQIFDKHVLDIRLEKSRIANNQKPVLSYSWDPNTGTMEYLPDDETNDAIAEASKRRPVIPGSDSKIDTHADMIDDDDFDDDTSVEF